MWGPPSGWDSAPSESHHKTEKKAPSKNTQRNASTFIEQTAARQLKNRTLQRAYGVFGLNQEDNSGRRTTEPVSGAKFTKSLDDHGDPLMTWDDCRVNQNKPTHPKKFCCNKILPMLNSMSIRGFTEHHRTDEDSNKKYIFRSSPSYRADSGQVCYVWYNWASFDHEGRGDGEKGIPAQILCLLDIRSWQDDYHSPGQYAVVRKFDSPPKKYRGNHSNIVCKGKLSSGLFLFDCETILETVAVVQDNTAPLTNNEFLVIRS